jgi:phosphotransferase system  glucose/maltose/N-acetylglucosamine-specific IIC component
MDGRQAEEKSHKTDTNSTSDRGRKKEGKKGLTVANASATYAQYQPLPEVFVQLRQSIFVQILPVQYCLVILRILLSILGAVSYAFQLHRPKELRILISIWVPGIDDGGSE